MENFEPHLVVEKEVRYAEGLTKATLDHDEHFGDVFGGIIKAGQWGWLTKGSRLCITSLRTGHLISKYDFDPSNGFGVCIITCISEIQIPYLKDTIIALGIQYADGPGGLVVLYSIEESTVISCIDFKHKITCCKFISHEVSQHTVLQNMNGCLAIGTDGGSVLLVDLNLRDAEIPVVKEETEISVVPCHIVNYSMSLLHLHRHFQHCQQEGVHFGIQLEVLENAEFIQSVLPIEVVLGLAVGLADGRLVMYDLTDMQVFYVAPPPERSSPLVKMSFMEPPDDPRHCVYVWAFHENYQNSMAVMHSLMYEKRVVADDGFCYFENFQASSVRLQLPLSCPKSVPIACQAISKAPSHGNEETISLCALVWKQEEELQTEVLLFDINQWYKEEMPYVGDWREDPSYLASFVLPGLCCLEIYFNSTTISLFNSIQRPEEHFYPISLSFDSIALGEKSCLHLNWPGIQNRVINVLRSQGSLALLDPNRVFIEALNARLLPQFSGLNYKATFSLKAKRETLLSIAIENNCIGLLKECAKCWADGSHQGSYLSEGLSLSTLTDWLWARASSIKERCNKLCKVLFDHSGYTLDQREKQELGYISKQLRTLADLSSDIISKFEENIPSDVLSTLLSQGSSIRMASYYQEILLWLLNIGLLPEASPLKSHRQGDMNLVPYPYESLKDFYEKRRLEFMRYSSRKERSCSLLFIDSFIDHSFKGNTLKDSWQESGGNGLYPPSSVQAMLRIMLIPDASFENKCALFLYFFLDLNMAIEDKQYEPVVQNFIKFPSVFKLTASLIKQIQAFWNLDHCHFQAAVDEFISPFNKDHVCPQWQIELFIASLLDQVEANLALRVLEAKSLPISPLLQLNTYLANDLISEAFHFARSEKDEELLKFFFIRCLLMKKFGVFRDLALTEKEGNLVQSLLKTSKNRKAEDLNFVYLLQKYKYIEAVAYQNELSKGRGIQRVVDDLSKGRNSDINADVDTPNLVLSAYNTTMTPVTKNMSEVYMKIKNRIKNKEAEQSSPFPLSCQLIKQNATDLLGGIYHSSALSTHFASYYWDRHETEGNPLQQSTNAPFLRSPQMSLFSSDYNPKEIISYPEPFKTAQKRRLDSNSVDLETKNENPKKRRKLYGHYDFELSTCDNLLTNIKNSSTHNQDMSVFKKVKFDKSSEENSFFLETPYVKNTATDGLSSQTTVKQGSLLPGILKVTTTSKISIDETDRVMGVNEEPEKKKDYEEEKSIRFTLPKDESLEQIQEQEVSIENEDALKQSTNESSQPLRTYAVPSARKSLRSPIECTSSISISKDELRSILDKIKNDQSSKVDILSLNVPKATKPFGVGQQPLEASIPKPYSLYSPSSTESPDLNADKSVEQIKISNVKQFEIHQHKDSCPRNEHKTPTTVVSESSDEVSNDSYQRDRKKLKGRAPIHPEVFSNNDSSTPTHAEESTNVVIQPSKTTLFSTDTIIDFKPHTSSSKVCATESRFSMNSTQFVQVVETASQCQTEKSSSKVTFSEQTTVTGDLTYIPPMEPATNFTKTLSEILQPSEKEQMLDTTVGMTLYDTTALEDNPLERHQQPSAISSSIVFEDDDDESMNSELKKLNDDTSENDNSETSVILLSSRNSSSSSLVSSNQTSESPEYEYSEIDSNDKRHISIDDDDEEDNYDDDGDAYDDDENFDEPSVDILESDDSENLSNSFSNKIRDVTSTSTSSSLANLLANEDSSQLKMSLPQADEVETSGFNTKSLTKTKKSETTKSDENKDEVVKGEQESSSSNETNKSKEKLYISSQSIDEQKVKVVSKEEDNRTNENICYLPKDPKGLSGEPKEIIIIDETIASEDNLAQNVENKSECKAYEILEIEIERDVEEIQPTEVDAPEQKIQSIEDIETITHNAQSIAHEEKQSKENEQIIDLNEQTETIITDQSECISKISETEENITEVDEQNNKVFNEETEKSISNQSECVSTISETEENITELDKQVKKELNKETETSIPNEKECTPKAFEAEGEKCITKASEGEGNITEVDKKGKTDLNEETETSIPIQGECMAKASEAEGNITEMDKKGKTDVKEETKTSIPKESECISKASETGGNISELDEKNKSTDYSVNDEMKTPPKSKQKAHTSINRSAPKLEKEEKTKDKSISSKANDHKKDTQEKNDQTELLKTDLFSDDSEKTHLVGMESPAIDDRVNKNEVSVNKEEDKIKRRSKSFSKNLNTETDVIPSPQTQRLHRSGSLPPSNNNKIVTRRRSLLLETLDEHATPDSPSSRTRSKIRSESIDGDGDIESPSVSHVKRSRLSSFSSVTSMDNPQTPKTRRRSSISMDKELENTPKTLGTPRTARAKSISKEVVTTPIKTPRRLSLSKKDSPPDDKLPSKSKVKKIEDEEDSKSSPTQSEAPQSGDYILSRRLTRTQLAAMERNSAMAKQLTTSPVIKIRRANNITEKESPTNLKGSDNESNSSRASYLSSSTTSRRITRSLALKENTGDDIVSIASSTDSNKRKRKRVKEQFSPIPALKVIPEEVGSGSEGSVANETIKRPSRHKK